MIASHIGVAAGAKRWAPRVPLWALLVATFLLDIFFGVLWLLGKERMDPLPDTDGGYGNLAFQVDWSHSFLGTLLLCLVVLIVCARFFGGKGAFILSCVVFSHWFLDSIVHRPDLPIAPGNPGALPRVGLGLWDAPIASLILEVLIIAGGALIWYTAPDATKRTRNAAVITGIVALVVLIADFTL